MPFPFKKKKQQSKAAAGGATTKTGKSSPKKNASKQQQAQPQPSQRRRQKQSSSAGSSRTERRAAGAAASSPKHRRQTIPHTTTTPATAPDSTITRPTPSGTAQPNPLLRHPKPCIVTEVGGEHDSFEVLTPDTRLDACQEREEIRKQLFSDGPRKEISLSLRRTVTDNSLEITPNGQVVDSTLSIAATSDGGGGSRGSDWQDAHNERQRRPILQTMVSTPARSNVSSVTSPSNSVESSSPTSFRRRLQQHKKNRRGQTIDSMPQPALGTNTTAPTASESSSVESSSGDDDSHSTPASYHHHRGLVAAATATTTTTTIISPEKPFDENSPDRHSINSARIRLSTITELENSGAADDSSTGGLKNVSTATLPGSSVVGGGGGDSSTHLDTTSLSVGATSNATTLVMGTTSNNNNQNLPGKEHSAETAESDSSDGEDDNEQDEDDDDEYDGHHRHDHGHYHHHDESTTHTGGSTNTTTGGSNSSRGGGVGSVARQLLGTALSCTPETTETVEKVKDRLTELGRARSVEHVMDLFYDRSSNGYCGDIPGSHNRNRGADGSGADNPNAKNRAKNRPYYDETFTLRFIRRMTTKGAALLALQAPGSEGNDSMDWKGRTATMLLEKGTTASSDLLQPRLEWTIIAGGQSFDISTTSVGLLDILSISTTVREMGEESKEEEEADVEDDNDNDNDGSDDPTRHTNTTTSSEDENLCFFTITTNSGEVYVFEANTPEERDSLVNGLKNVIARLSFHLIVGDTTASSELYDYESTGPKLHHPSHEALQFFEDPGDLPALPNPKQAMNRISHIMLD